MHAVPTRAAATAAEAAEIIRDICLRVLAVDHDPEFTSDVFRAFVTSTNAKFERAKGVIGDTLRADANARKD